MDKTILDHNDKFSNLKMHVIVFLFTKVVHHTGDHYLYYIYIISYFRIFSCICFILTIIFVFVQKHLTKNEDQQDGRAYYGATVYHGIFNGKGSLLWGINIGSIL